ncbi:hypothetical protein CRE_24603 [Caenorhabditis remanei]|uniref:Rab-GAP TBC domain-containing protein n=1 Tax=Caenorhabditis remanei TaxID=31234 RepID=E3MVE7_CAERE|nr:hypothetical protein CRE_24603 [Caenorhabditis remanei]
MKSMKVPVISLDATDTDEDENNPNNFRRNGSVRKVREIQMDVAIGEAPGSPSTLDTVFSRFGRSQSLRRPPAAKSSTKKDESGTPGSSRAASPTPSFIDISPIIRTASLRVKNQLAHLVHGLTLKGCNNNNQGEAEDAGSSSDEDDPEYLELLERDSIINRYEKGPDAVDVDAWENPDFEVYTNLDRFGFVHKKGDKTDERTDAQKRRIIKELSREKKWLKMIEVWKSGGPSKKMEDRIWKGIPEKLRIVIWPRLLGAERMKHERRDMYSELLLRARLVSKDIKQIDLDINRTYRDHLAFRKRYDVKVYKYLEKQDIPYIYLTKWWFGCFLDRVPFSLALRLWDVFLVEGDSILLAMAYNIMKMHEKSIRKHSMESFMEFIQNDIAQDFGYSDDEVMYSLRETLTKLKGDRQHVPPPPRPEDLSEVPTKALGPILQKPMASIREEIHEIQSRRSRANCEFNRRIYEEKYQIYVKMFREQLGVHDTTSSDSDESSEYSDSEDSDPPAAHHIRNEKSRLAEHRKGRHQYNTNGMETHRKTRLLEMGERCRLRYQNHHNSNPSRGGTPSAQRLRDERNGQMVLLSRASDSEPDATSPTTNQRDGDWNSTANTHISTATSRITHSGNNITRIELDGDVSVI